MQAIDQATKAEPLRHAGLDFSSGAQAFRVKPELGSRDVVLRDAKIRPGACVNSRAQR